MEQTQFKVAGMTCQGCVRSVRNVLETLPGAVATRPATSAHSSPLSSRSTSHTARASKAALSTHNRARRRRERVAGGVAMGEAAPGAAGRSTLPWRAARPAVGGQRPAISRSYSSWSPIQNHANVPPSSIARARCRPPTRTDQNRPTRLKWRDGCRGSSFSSSKLLSATLCTAGGKSP